MILVLAIQTEILSLLSRVLACDVTRNKYVGEFVTAHPSAFPFCRHHGYFSSTILDSHQQSFD